MGKKFLKFLLDTRYGFALFMALISVVLSAVLGLFFSAITGSFPSDFMNTTTICFWFFFAPGVVAAILLMVTSIPDNLVFGFACGLYYGTAFATGIIDELLKFEGADIFLGFIVVALLCYIIWLTHFKNGQT